MENLDKILTSKQGHAHLMAHECNQCGYTSTTWHRVNSVKVCCEKCGVPIWLSWKDGKLFAASFEE